MKAGDFCSEMTTQMAHVRDFGPKMRPPARVLAVRLWVRTQAVKARLNTKSLVYASSEEARLNGAGHCVVA